MNILINKPLYFLFFTKENKPLMFFIKCSDELMHFKKPSIELFFVLITSGSIIKMSNNKTKEYFIFFIIIFYISALTVLFIYFLMN